LRRLERQTLATTKVAGGHGECGYNVVACPAASGEVAMTLTVEAVYENGVLKPARPLPLRDHEKVRVTVVREASVAQQTYGLMGWTGDAATVERFALDPELDPQESA
jgi:predicted DNA-binding antitoxin AbrB/MazE fold protein